ncbi:hypothetical protein KQ304_03610 [Synechococcus sp. CS-1329]|uniref:hypothetical protein n=1 Tax=Synechococcus sp. CS-1329 TaxID=2847975 RepID=UPI00223C3395|nr:hypothetical protein [Synechococcus sp. CS-1329]MCT0218092.1 hypothetical protein [Synechococcus sp. CS-1329]
MPQDLLQALAQRDGALLAAHSLRWAHRHGVEALEKLIEDQGLDHTARLWWREQLFCPAPMAVTMARSAAPAALPDSRPAEVISSVPAAEPVLSAPVQGESMDSVPLPAEWLLPASFDLPAAVVADKSDSVEPPVPEAPEGAELDAAVAEFEAMEPPAAESATPAPATPEPPALEPAVLESAGVEPAVLEPVAATSSEPLPSLAEAFGPIPDLEPLPSFNVQAIFAMQSELAERPLAPPIVPPLMVPPPAQLELEAFPPAALQSQPELQPDAQAELQAVAPADAVAVPAPPTSEERAVEKPSGARRNPFSRLRGLIKDCVEEVASTFGNDERDAPPTPLEPARSSAEAVLPSTGPLLEAFPVQPAAARGPMAPPPFALQQPPQPTRQAQRRRAETGSAGGPAARANRPAPAAPAPSHPALDSLRSWLPDPLEQDDHRQAS